MLRRFFASEPAAGIMLLLATVAALIVANSPLSSGYEQVLHASVAGLSVHAWINDALMALFFLLVGLEIKREMVEGELSTWPSRVLPGCAALCGMIAPAAVFLLVTRSQPDLHAGWAVPTATDIAFALGILALLGSRVPVFIKVLLTSIAVIDDLGAVLVIALFYTDALHPLALGVAALAVVVLLTLNRRGVDALWPYALVGIVLWIAIFRSGLHATLAGVILALTIPLATGAGDRRREPVLHRLESGLDPWVSFGIVPLFAFANAGLPLSGFSLADLRSPLPVGIALALVVGKQAGVFGAIWAGVRLEMVTRPPGITWLQLYGMALLCGIGFTMSLFIGGLAFADQPHLMDLVRLGVLGGSLVAAVLGTLVLRRAVSASPTEDDASHP
ncbi:MAG: Na+/H+ antiporter NhaA [Thermomicrobiales bacterium]